MSTSPSAYAGFDRMPIGSEWRPGRAGRELTDTDPWSGDVLTRIPLANAADVETGPAENPDERPAAGPPPTRGPVPGTRRAATAGSCWDIGGRATPSTHDDENDHRAGLVHKVPML
jgi:hypothetical protein